MKNLSLVINGVLAVAVGVLFYLHFKDCAKAGCCQPSTVTTKDGKTTVSGNGTIAYVDIDTLENNYTFFIDKKNELEKRQKAIELTLQGDAAQLQRRMGELQAKAQTMTQSEGEAAQQEMYQRQAALEQKKESMAASFMAEQTKFNQDLNARLDTFLTTYNADKHYSYIMSYTRGGGILFKDKALDITKEVTDGMNAQLKK
jgi:outer membrane protein